MRPYDLTGRRFGKLTALSVSVAGNGQKGWLCECDCGNNTVVRTTDLVRNHTKSCGCTRTHGLSKTPLYDTWYNILRRCCNETDKAYKYYGARGITICDEWKDYPTFYDWCIKNGYEEGLTIDRIDNTEGYCPSNCRFVTMKDQERNKLNNLHVEYEGERMLLVEFSERFKIPYTTVYWRYKHGRNLRTGRCVVDDKL